MLLALQLWRLHRSSCLVAAGHICYQEGCYCGQPASAFCFTNSASARMSSSASRGPNVHLPLGAHSCPNLRHGADATVGWYCKSYAPAAKASKPNTSTRLRCKCSGHASAAAGAPRHAATPRVDDVVQCLRSATKIGRCERPKLSWGSTHTNALSAAASDGRCRACNACAMFALTCVSSRPLRCKSSSRSVASRLPSMTGGARGGGKH